MARTESTKIDNTSIKKTADAIAQLVQLNKETGKQTKIMILLTVVITILTLVMSVAVIIDLIA